MKKYFRSVFLNRTSLLWLALLLVFFSIALSLNMGWLTDQRGIMSSLDLWIKGNQFYFILSHIALILAIYVGWDIRIERHVMTLNDKASIGAIQKAKQFRWVLIGAVLLISFLARL